MNYFSNKKFWQKLVIGSLIPLIVISISIGILSFNKADEAAKITGKNNLEDAVNRTDIGITLRTRQLDHVIQAITDSLRVSIIDESNEEKIEEFISYMMEPFQEVEGVTLYDRYVDIFKFGNASPISVGKLQRFRDDTKGNASKTFWSDIHSPTGSKKMYVYRAWDDGGIIIVELKCDKIGSALLSKQKINDDQISFIVDRNNNIIYSDSVMPKGLYTNVMKQYKDGKRMFDVNVRGKKTAVCTQYNGYTGWKTVSTIKHENLFKEGEELRSYIVTVITVCIVFALIMLFITSKIITKPLAVLNNAMKQVREQNFKVHIKNNRKDEIGDITDTFNFMVEKIEELVNRVYVEEIAQKNAELAALQAQINPHFLYNSLDSINWDLIERGEMDISNVVVALGKIMQYSMDTDTSKVPIRDEYDNAKDYLLVQHNRLDDQLEYELLLDPELEEVIVPKLILQPLIENAIKYGVIQSHRKCKVTVKTELINNNIVLTVTDDGAGMSVEQLNDCRASMQKGSKKNVGIGLNNVARRLQLHFGTKCEFNIESLEGEGTSIQLKIPYSDGGDAGEYSSNR